MGGSSSKHFIIPPRLVPRIEINSEQTWKYYGALDFIIPAQRFSQQFSPEKNTEISHQRNVDFDGRTGVYNFYLIACEFVPILYNNIRDRELGHSNH